MVNAIARPQTVAQLDSLATSLVDKLYRPFLPSLPLPGQPSTTPAPDCWVDKLELDAVTASCTAYPKKIKLLVIYGSLRERYDPVIHALPVPLSYSWRPSTTF